MDGGGVNTKIFVASGGKDVAVQECNLLCSMDGDNVCREQKGVCVVRRRNLVLC